MKVSETPEWHHLVQLSREIEGQSLVQLFENDENRFEQFSYTANELLCDFSKQKVNAAIIEALIALAKACHLEEKIAALFNGDIVNITEKRPALHMALRDHSKQSWQYQGEDIKPQVLAAFDKLETFVHSVHKGSFKGVTGQTITDVISLGIGGSDLGPLLACQALKPFHHPTIKVHFISNLDADTLEPLLNQINPESTLCLVNSKTFTTIETMENAKRVRHWLESSLGDGALKQCVAVTANVEKAEAFGFEAEQVFPFWDWVGGRYSLWSSVGLAVALQIGVPHFKALLAGAHTMDNHFRETALEANIPVLMGLIGVWNINFQGCDTLGIMPYADGLFELPNYLQQLEMESNGKQALATEGFVSYQTAPIIWGGVGCNGQHAYMQMLHQGPKVIPMDFIVPVRARQSQQSAQSILVANALAQSKALMEGREFVALKEAHIKEGMSEEQAFQLAEARVCPGDRPSTTIMFSEIQPSTLGQLIALYEHKVFVQSVIWQINPFDQWGVELGKELAKSILPAINEGREASDNKLDPSTKGLIQRFHQG